MKGRDLLIGWRILVGITVGGVMMDVKNVDIIRYSS